MNIAVYKTKDEMGAAAASAAASKIRQTIDDNNQANIILATGASQFEMLGYLAGCETVDWPKVTMFHLDEYIGLGPGHPASFRRYLQERFVDRVAGLKAVHYINGDAEDPAEECRRLGDLIRAHPADVACLGIGENGHLAFNDPPADFETEESYIVVDLDERCRQQQVGEGWFESFESVPPQALSMSISQILKSRSIIVTVPDHRKAEAVRNVVEGPVTPRCPASILQKHENCSIFLDEPAASLLSANS